MLFCWISSFVLALWNVRVMECTCRREGGGRARAHALCGSVGPRRWRGVRDGRAARRN